MCISRIGYLKMALQIEKEVFWLNIAMGDPLAMQIGHPHQYLLEAAFDFAR